MMMLRFYADKANACTLAGLCFGAVAIACVVGEQSWLGLSMMLAAVLCDIFDGTLARATSGRDKSLFRFGAMLDSLADQVHSVLAPAFFIAVALGGSSGLVLSAGLVLAGTMRLSYFNTFGLSEGGAFTGLPVFYSPIILAVVASVGEILPSVIRSGTFIVFALGVAAAQISTLRVPRFNDWRYWAVASAAGVLGLCCLSRAFGEI